MKRSDDNLISVRDRSFDAFLYNLSLTNLRILAFQSEKLSNGILFVVLTHVVITQLERSWVV